MSETWDEIFEAMDAGRSITAATLHQFSRVRVGRIRDRVKRSVTADHVAILVEPIAISIVLPTFATERVMDRFWLYKVHQELGRRETSASKQRGKSDNSSRVSSHSSLVFIPKVCLGPQAVRIQEL